MRRGFTSPEGRREEGGDDAAAEEFSRRRPRLAACSATCIGTRRQYIAVVNDVGRMLRIHPQVYSGCGYVCLNCFNRQGNKQPSSAADFERTKARVAALWCILYWNEGTRRRALVSLYWNNLQRVLQLWGPPRRRMRTGRSSRSSSLPSG